MDGVLPEFNIYLLDNSRSRAYLQLLIKNRLVPAHIYVLYPPDKEVPDVTSSVVATPTDGYFFVQNETVFHTLHKNNLSYTLVRNVDLNSKEIIELSKTIPGLYTIYCGGPILQEELLSTPSTFIHCHPGRTPDFKGSTCFYYSLLAEKKMGVSCFFMAVGLDEGETLSQKEFNPVKGVDIDNIFDPWMRGQTLIAALKLYIEDNHTFEPIPQVGEGETYFVIHPVLKTIAIDVANNFGEAVDEKFTWPSPSPVNYEYTAQDRLINPHKYSFAPFGATFFGLYQDDREMWSKKIQEKLAGSPKQIEELVAIETPHKTSEELRKIVIQILEGESSEHLEKKLSPWVKKYEVWKRLYTVYDDNFRKASEDCSFITSYMLLSLACLLTFKKNKNFKFLNVALKLNDCICSKVSEILSTADDLANDVHLTLLCLNSEKEIIQHLVEETTPK